jgi:hypothetical protein
MIEHLVGLQSQVATSPYVGLWTRSADFSVDTLSTLILDRAVVRLALMRSTIHTVTARDCLVLRPAVQPALDRGLKSSYGRALDGLDLAAVGRAGRTLVETTPATFQDLGRQLARRWKDRDPEALAQAVRTRVPLVQIPPRGVWGAGGQAVYTSAEAWLGREPDTSDADARLDRLVRRYLAAFGPASVKDIQKWSGLVGMRAVVERLRPHLQTFTDEHGVELFDVPDGPRPGPDAVAPVRFLPEYDNVIVAHDDRTRILATEHKPLVFSVNGIRPTFLVDGFVRGHWRLERAPARTSLLVQPIDRITKAQRVAVTEEGERLLAFAAADARATELRILPLG